MSDLTCESCGKTFDHEDEGAIHPETGDFDCASCIDWFSLRGAIERDPGTAHRYDPNVAKMKADPVRFYTLCKDDPGRL